MADRKRDTRDRANGGQDARGFASMDDDRQREIASMGGRAAHERGTAHEFDPREAREAGRKGGETISRNREHMAEIGRRGGQAVSQNRDHMAAIGRRGGEAISQNRDHMAEIGREGGQSAHDEPHAARAGSGGDQRS